MVGTEGQGDFNSTNDEDAEGRNDFNPAISDDEDKKEYFDTPEELKRYSLCNSTTYYYCAL